MEKPSVDWRIDAVFGLFEVHSVAIRALLMTHPDPHSFEAHFDRLLDVARVRLLNGDSSDLAIAALDDYSASLKAALPQGPAVPPA